MRHRDRVLAALNHETTDRPPFQAHFVSEFAARLRAHYGLPSTAEDANEVQFEWHGCDLERLTDQDVLVLETRRGRDSCRRDQPFTDDWGVQFRIDHYTTPYGPGVYANIDHSPLSDEEPDLSGYAPPDPNDPIRCEWIERAVREFGDEYFIAANVTCTIFELAWALRGFENLLMDLLVDPDLAEQIIDMPFQYNRQVARKAAAVGADMVWLGDDWGSETSLLVNPDLWRRVFKPRYAEICSDIKAANPDCKIAFHSDGNVMELIDDLIDVGVDVLNPIQTECLDTAELQRRFGDRLCFWGGMSVQSVLPHGTPEQIRAEYERLKSTIGQGGGWICAPTHWVQLDTPIENFFALARCVKED